MGKRNLDNLFQEKFKDFHEVPDKKVWEAIEASLGQKKKSRRIIPIWWKLGGVAAVVAMLFYVTNPFGNKIDTDTIITGVENTDVKTSEQNSTTNKTGFETPASVDKKVGDATKEEEEGIFDTPKGNKENNVNTLPKNLRNQKSGITATEAKNFLKKDADHVMEKKSYNVLPKNNKEGVAVVPNEIKKDTDKALASENSKKNVVDQDLLKKPTAKDAIVQVEGKKETDSKGNAHKKSIFDEIEQGREKEAVAKNNKDKWSVGPSIAPVYFDSFGEGSPIHSNFVPNSKSGNVSLSYGVSVSYNVTKKLSIRSGLHKVDYGYDTNEITFSSSLEGSTNRLIDNIDYARTSRNLVVQSKANGRYTSNEMAAMDIAAENPSLDGRMVQQFGYLEVPLELNYAIVDSKLGIHIIGGVSSLFLVNNSVTLESESLALDMGDANNINNINFSTNIGVGINYRFTPKTQLNLEPVFKYQLNTFSETAGSFQPFSVGIYSGLSFKF